MRRPLTTLAFLVLILAAAWVAWINWDVTRRFEGRRWDLPAQVFARPLELYAGLAMDVAEFEREIERLGYREARGRPRGPGSYRRDGDRVDIVTRPFRFADGDEPSQRLSLSFGRNGLAAMARGGRDLALARLEPLMIGSIFPDHGEDRLVVAPDEVPPLLRDALIAVEDRRFESHLGIDPLAMLRAAAANLRAGSITQGGSTLTQQLVKNYFLDNRRTLWRKLREAVTAVILELHYGKDELLNAYINEIYLGQDGKRSIHGFGLASRFYFSRPLPELQLHQLALLVALVRGPGYYDPITHPERALERRNLVLQLMQEAGVIEAQNAGNASRRELDVWDRKRRGGSYYPAYLQLVREQLASDYEQEDLTREGLRVFSALDPVVQAAAERRLASGLDSLEHGRRPDESGLAGAVVVSQPSSGEVLAVVGDRRAGYEGFNRALHARRPIGSLVKPAVYLAAIESGEYSLADTVVDEPLQVRLENGDTWAPRNFDQETHGAVSLLYALSNSLNLATVRLGLDIGVDRVADVLGRLGFTGELRPYPSLLLGSVGMTPIEVAGVYGTLANGGFRAPHRAVRSVVDASGEFLQRYGVEVSQVADAATVHQVNEALVQVMQRGTGKSVANYLPDDLVLAGKTGTSSDFRDSWFAGFTGSHAIVVWVGHDDNRPSGLTGSTGALPIAATILGDIQSSSWSPALPAPLETRWVQYETGLEVARHCPGAVALGLPRDERLRRGPRCGIDVRELGKRTMDWLRDVID